MKWRMFFRQHTTDDGTEVGVNIESPQEWQVVDPTPLLEATREDMRLLASVTDTSPRPCGACSGHGTVSYIGSGPYRYECRTCGGSGLTANEEGR